MDSKALSYIVIQSVKSAQRQATEPNYSEKARDYLNELKNFYSRQECRQIYLKDFKELYIETAEKSHRDHLDNAMHLENLIAMASAAKSSLAAFSGVTGVLAFAVSPLLGIASALLAYCSYKAHQSCKEIRGKHAHFQGNAETAETMKSELEKTSLEEIGNVLITEEKEIKGCLLGNTK